MRPTGGTSSALEEPEGTVKILIDTNLPNAIFNCIQDRISAEGTAETAKEVWDALKPEA